MAKEKSKEESKNPYLPKMAKIDRITKESEDAKIFKIRHEMECIPGQFAELSLFGFGEAPFAVCSSSKNHVEFCILNAGNLTNAIHNLKQGDKIGIRGPYGNGYPIDNFRKKNVIIIAGGTGIASPKSFIQYIEKNQEEFGNVRIFLGFRTPDEILFKKDIEEWKKKFDVELTVDDSDKSWKGNTGLITDLIEKKKVSKENTRVIVCGPPIMIKFAVQLLQKLGFADDQIYVSLERLMKCGIGKCGRCMVKGKFICKDGPVFRYDEAKLLED